MTIAKLKAKNQLTIPGEIIRKLHLKANELFAVDIEENYIKLVPVDIEPKYTSEELQAMDRLVQTQKGKGKTLKAGKEFSEYIQKIAK